jgi:hypothetical protein
MKSALILVLAAGAVSADPVIYDNGPWTGEPLMSSQYDSAYPFESEVADDFRLDDDYIVTDAHWIGGYFNGSPILADWTVRFYDDNAGSPGNMIYSETFAGTDVNQTSVGFDGTGTENFSYDVVLSAPWQATAGDTYWVSFQGVNFFPPQSAVSATSAVNGNVAQFKSAFFGFPDWVDTTAVFGVAYDVPFQITGVIPAPASIALLGLGALVRRRR